ncbi:MAG: hypothetical protein J6T08_05070 [Lentisphaeria bacterium]|nr:hypothetical protein [Lentisphaeria bacterium]
MFRIECFKKHGENYEKHVYVVVDYDKYINDQNEVFLIVDFGDGEKKTIAEKCFDDIDITVQW